MTLAASAPPTAPAFVDPSARDAMPTLARLIAPITVPEFIANYWEKKPLVVRRSDPQYYADLLTFEDMDQIIARSTLASDVRIVNDSRETPVVDLLEAEPAGRFAGSELLYAAYRKGATVVLNALHERWEPLTDICRALAAECSATFQINVYMTPAGRSRGLGKHYDTHDVFVLQAGGSKHWKLFGSPMRLPLRDHPFLEPRDDDEVPDTEVTLEAGDMVYLPRGYKHVASSEDRTSLHMTLGVVPVTWAYVVRTVLEDLVGEDPEFRESLPLGFAHSGDRQAAVLERFERLMERLTEHASGKAALSNAVRRASMCRLPDLRGHLVDLERIDTLTLDATVRRRPGLVWHMTKLGDRVSIEFHGKTITLPAHVGAALDRLGTGDPCSGRDLPDTLDDDGRLILLRRLLQEGFLTFADAGERRNEGTP